MNTPTTSDLRALKRINRTANEVLKQYVGLTDETKQFIEENFESDNLLQFKDVTGKALADLKKLRETNNHCYKSRKNNPEWYER
jgi:hypothetical protein